MKIDVLLPGHGRIIAGADNVQRELRTAAAAVERFLDIRAVARGTLRNR